MTALLRVQDLHVYFDTSAGTVRANNGVSLELNQGESVGIMGESGCGKTVLFLSLLHLQQPGRIVKGEILFDGRDITALPEREMQSIRGRMIALVPQNQATALNPAYTIRQQLAEALAIRRSGGGLLRHPHRSHEAAAVEQHEIAAVFQELGFDTGATLSRLLHSYPHQLSGGMRQRVLIAMALLLQPRLLIADEPTTALDRAIKAQSLSALERLRGRLTMLVVSHDIDAIAAACDRVAIMYGGRVIEAGPAAQVLSSPLHPYTRLLLAAQRRTRGEPLHSVTADTLNLIDFPPGCPFHPACPRAAPLCRERTPETYPVDESLVSCHLYAREVA